MKIEINLLTKNTPFTLNLYEAELQAKDIDSLEVLDVLIFPIELVYSIKHVLTTIHLALDNLPEDIAMLQFKHFVKDLFYNKKKPFRSFYGKYVVVFLDCDPNFKNKRKWDTKLSSVAGQIYLDVLQVRKTYNITEQQVKASLCLEGDISTTMSHRMLTLMNKMG